MAFEDIPRIVEYQQLARIRERTKPYRSAYKINRYPLGNRRYSDRFFQPVNSSDSNSPLEIYYTERYKLGTFHPDDTFVFDPGTPGYSQGDGGILSHILPGWVTQKSNYGGCVFVHRSGIPHPIFQGLRVRLSDGKPAIPYTMHVENLDRKLTKPYRDKYEDMFAVARPMLKAMGHAAIVTELTQMRMGQVAPAYNYKGYELDKAFDPKDAVGAVLWLSLRYNAYDSRSFPNSWIVRRFEKTPIDDYVTTVKQTFFKEIYTDAIKKGENITSTKVIMPGERLPTVEWGHTIYVDGVKQTRI